MLRLHCNFFSFTLTLYCVLAVVVVVAVMLLLMYFARYRYLSLSLSFCCLLCLNYCLVTHTSAVVIAIVVCRHKTCVCNDAVAPPSPSYPPPSSNVPISCSLSCQAHHMLFSSFVFVSFVLFSFSLSTLPALSPSLQSLSPLPTKLRAAVSAPLSA